MDTVKNKIYHVSGSSNDSIPPPKKARFIDDNLSTCSEFTTESESDSTQSENDRMTVGIPSRSSMLSRGSEKRKQVWDAGIIARKPDLFKLLKKKLEGHVQCDVKICIDDTVFNCHRLVLQCYSDLLLDVANTELLIRFADGNMSAKAFTSVYKWMLADNPFVRREGILDMYNAARALQIHDLQNQCWHCFDDETCFCEDSAFMLYKEARPFDMALLQQLMLRRICRFFLTLVASKDFLDFTIDELCAILSLNTIGVNSESEIYMCVVRWLNYKWHERKADVLKAVRCIRFALMPNWFLVSLGKHNETEVEHYLTSNPKVLTMIEEGVSYAAVRLSFEQNGGSIDTFLGNCKMRRPLERQWILDKNCAYHCEPFGMSYILTYSMFLEYLTVIQKGGKDYWRSLQMFQNKTTQSLRTSKESLEEI